MKQLRQALDRIPRIVRILIDLLLAAVLLLCWYIAKGSPAFGEEATFRRAEQAAMVGPSVLLDRLYTRSDWPFVNYNLLLIGDDGDSVLFYTMQTGKRSTSMDNVLTRREKTDGVLLTALPSDAVFSHYLETALSVPLLLFVDDPAAVKATVRLTMSDGSVLTMTQIRDWHNHELLSESERDGYVTGNVRDNFFLFEHIVSPDWQQDWAAEYERPRVYDEWQSDWIGLMETNTRFSHSHSEWPAVIELYDAQNRLIRTVDYTIRSRALDAHAYAQKQ